MNQLALAWKSLQLANGLNRLGAALSLLLIVAAPPLQADDFNAGLEAYHAGDYAEATKAFERSLEVDETAAVRHNLALSLYQQGRPAKAVWQLERALRLDPLNQSYRLKLEALRQQLGLYVSPSPWWKHAAKFLSFGAWVWIASLSLWVLLASIALPRLAGRSPRRPGNLVLGLSAFSLLLSLAALTLQTHDEPTGTIIADAPVSMHHAPASAAPEAGQARPGERIRQIDQHQNFIRIETEAGITGWVQADTLKEI
jgi:tetratricopeptide (TPR) repeat protein